MGRQYVESLATESLVGFAKSGSNEAVSDFCDTVVYCNISEKSVNKDGAVLVTSQTRMPHLDEIDVQCQCHMMYEEMLGWGFLTMQTRYPDEVEEALRDCSTKLLLHKNVECELFKAFANHNSRATVAGSKKWLFAKLKGAVKLANGSCTCGGWPACVFPFPHRFLNHNRKGIFDMGGR